jgi:hypothetical protein
MGQAWSWEISFFILPSSVGLGQLTREPETWSAVFGLYYNGVPRLFLR